MRGSKVSSPLGHFLTVTLMKTLPESSTMLIMMYAYARVTGDGSLLAQHVRDASTYASNSLDNHVYSMIS